MLAAAVHTVRAPAFRVGFTVHIISRANFSKSPTNEAQLTSSSWHPRARLHRTRPADR